MSRAGRWLRRRVLVASVVMAAVCAAVAVGLVLAVTSHAGQERAGQKHAGQGNAAREDAAGVARRPAPGPAGQGPAGRLAVVGDAPASRLVEIRRDADEALRYVRAVWDGPWADQVVVEVPAGGAGFRAESGRTGTDGEAAVAVLPGEAPGVGRVIVNPEVYDRLTVEGRQVVLRHEFTHLASADVTGAGTPTWLVEGLAETVGHAGVGLEVPRAAAELAARVRSGWLPDALPGDAAFSAADGAAPARYQEAWLACRLIADRVGLDGLIRFYRQVGSGGGDPPTRLAGALRAVLGTTEADFVTQWRSYLEAQLRS
ncbi:hypothetical protein [Protofrankia symbiont of Coriaria ruscifolia]|uniref:hypothetical protein n=1 Tax=Protofrankia symbiont of Coriaria ruscifolia TaxID=1306542 RepID=UPI00104137E7|nr:hypothetical protein [Protofrankia symbiont of Coriaria ruscifolia]